MSEEPPIFVAAQRFNEHAIHQAVKDLRVKLRDTKIPLLNELPQGVRATLVRARWVLRDLARRLTRVDPLLASPYYLDQANTHVTNVSNVFAAFAADPANQQQALEDQLTPLTRFLPGLSTGGFREDSFEDFTEHLSGMATAVAEAKAKLDELKKEADETRTKLKETRDEAKGVKQEVESQKGRIDEFITNNTTAFNDGETKRAQAASDALDKRRQEAADWLEQEKKNAEERAEAVRKKQDEQLATAGKEVKKFIAEHTTKSSEALAEINKKLEQARELVRLVSDEVTTGNYEEVAKRELASARTMRRWAVGLFVAGALSMLGIGIGFSVLNGAALDLWTVLLRSLFGAILFVPAGYCAREASRHWVSERAHRRIALELKSIHPFLEPLELATRLEIIKERAKEYFGNKMPPEFGDGKPKAEDGGISGRDLLEALKAKGK